MSMLFGKQSPKHHLRRRSVTLGTGRLRPAPDALALARAVAMLTGERMVAPRAVTRRAAPLAARGIVAMLVLASRRMMAPRPSDAEPRFRRAYARPRPQLNAPLRVLSAHVCVKG